MEKNKGLFSFRKHPVGNFLDEKKGRKRKGGRLRRSMGFLMAAALIFNTLPASGFAVSASEQEKGLCEHHRSHTAECGYAEAQPCTHEHGEECYKTVTECVHEHTDECYPETGETDEGAGEGNAASSDEGNRESVNCTHVCSEESGCITKVLDCRHEHDGSCGYQEAQDCGYVCEICNGTEPEDTENNAENDTEDAGTDTAECICETLCTEDSINGDCPVCGAEDADLSRCKGEKTEEQEKTGEKVITAWEWIDPEEYLTDGMLALPGAGRENPAFMEDVTALLPEKMQAKVVIVNAAEDGEETEEDAEALLQEERMEITLTGWECASYPKDGAYEGTYTFTAFLPGGFVLAEDAAALEVKVELGGAKMLAETVSVSYQEASWGGSEVTYTGKTENCTVVESSAGAVTWNAGWYVVNGAVTISKPITVIGAVNLILADGCTLNANSGIVVTDSNSLTIYAQSGGTGTLTATGTVTGVGSGIKASAGIGGSAESRDSGSVTIHGGVINATGGGKNGYVAAAGIGGGSDNAQNGGNSDTVTIYGGMVTANSGWGTAAGAGIGGGAAGVSRKKGGDGSGITIYGGTVRAEAGSTGGAGIGGGGSVNGTGGSGTNIAIHGGSIQATGGVLGAGIGGGGGGGFMSGSSGKGENITISGGQVTAVGGAYAAGIGGGGGYKEEGGDISGGGGDVSITTSTNITGGTGNVTITGGIVDAKGGVGYKGGDMYKGDPIGNGGNQSAAATVSKSTAIVFEDGEGIVCGAVTFDGNYTVPADYTLHIPIGASLSGSGTLSGGSAFTTENLTADMISVPTNLYYNGEDRTEYLTTELGKGIEICGKTFMVSGWTLAVTKTGDLTYTATYTNNNDNTNTFTKTITLLQSGTKFEGGIKTYNGETETTSFTAGDTITVKAAPTATGRAPQKTAARLWGSYTEPTAGQMALFVGDVQVSEPVEAGADGIYTMTISASKVLLQGNAKPNGNAITLTAKFVGNDNMADAAGTVDVRISAVAMAERDGTVIGYYGESNLADAFANDGATVTLLDDVTVTSGLTVKSGQNITFEGGSFTLAQTLPEGATANMTDAALTVEQGGTLTVKSGTITSPDVALNSYNGTLYVEGGEISGGKAGLVYGADCHISGGKLTGGEYAAFQILSDLDVRSILLNFSDDTADKHYAFYQNGNLYVPTGAFLPNGIFTVKECQHKDVTPTANNDGTHTLSCPYCGYHSEHTTALTATASGNTVTFRGACASCEYRAETLATAAFTIPKLTYGQTDQTVSCTWEHPEGYSLMVQIDSGDELQLDDSATQASFPLKQLFGNQKINAGNYQLNVYCLSYAGAKSDACFLPFTIAPAPLTADMVTLAGESATYNGTEQKPALTVKQGETMLAEGTDYEVIYTRDGVVTNDFTSAGTVNITVTGKGNYTGTVTKTFTIGKATPTITWSSTTQERTYTGQQATITEPTVMLVNNENFKGTISYSYRKQGETAHKDGLPTDAGTYTVKAHVDAEGNYTAAGSKDELTLTIKKADAVIAIGTDTYHKTFGDAAFTLEVTDNNLEADVQYEVTEGTDVVSVENGTAAIRNAGKAVITVSLPETANYNAAENKTITVSVAKKSGYTVDVLHRSHYYPRESAGSVDLAVLLPKDCGDITYQDPETTGGVAYSAGPSVNGGKLSYTVKSGKEGDKGTITVTAATRNYEDIAITVEVELTDRLTVSEKEGKEVALRNDTLTYGEPLSKLVFHEAAFVDSNADAVEGSLAWKDAQQVPETGTASAVWVFTPADDQYEKLEGNIAITVKKAVPEVTAPEGKARVYHPVLPLTDSDLSGGLAKGVDGKPLAGTWRWKYANIVPVVDNGGYEAVFTPEGDGGTNYETVTVTIPVAVTKAVPYIAARPAASSVTYGDTLEASTLSGGNAQYGNGAGQVGEGIGSTEIVAGAFTWKEPATKPAAADSGVTEYPVVFTPTDAANYSSAQTKAVLAVNRAQSAPNMPGSAMDAPDGTAKVGDIALPDGWEWREADREIVLAAGTTVSAVAVYIGAGRGNYEVETVTVDITVAKTSCDHTAGDVILYTGAGEKAPTCTEDGLGHKECTKCGTVVESGITVPALGHDYTSEVIKEPTPVADGEKTYTCSRCGNTYTEPVPHTTPEGLWVSGVVKSVTYTGSAVEPEGVRVYHGGTLLREKAEYTISYQNNTNAGTAQVVVTGKGSYKGKATAEFTIEAVDISADTNISATAATAVENGKTLKPAVAVTWNGKKLKEKKDYTLSYDKNIKSSSADGYDVTISGTGNFKGTIVRKFLVAPRGTLLLNRAKVTGLSKSYPYAGGGAQGEAGAKPAGLEDDLGKLAVKIGKTTLTKDTDYTVRIEKADSVGTGTVIVEPAPGSAYAGEKRISFKVTGTDLKKGSITGLGKSYPYTGEPVEPEIHVYSGGKGAGVQIPSDAYTVRYRNCINSGKASVTVTGIPEKGYSGSITASYTVGKYDIGTGEKDGGITVQMPEDVKYAKGGAKPRPVITYTGGGTACTLREGVDYKLKYSNNTSAAGAKEPVLKITGTGNYCGTVVRTYGIEAQELGSLTITVADKAYNSKKKGSYYYAAPKVYDLDGKQLKPKKDYTVQYFDAATSRQIGEKDTVSDGAEIRVVVTAARNSGYTGTLETTYHVRGAKDVKDIAKAGFDKIPAQQYTGGEIRPEVRLYWKTGKTKNDLSEEDYEIIGYYNNIKMGKATVLIRGRNAYSGVKSVTFKITAADNRSIWNGIF